jgi:hypothetical protein
MGWARKTSHPVNKKMSFPCFPVALASIFHMHCLLLSQFIFIFIYLGHGTGMVAPYPISTTWLQCPDFGEENKYHLDGEWTNDYH